MDLRKRLFTFLLVSMLVVAPFAASALEAGRPAPGFTLKNLSGQDVSLADFRGGLVLLKLATTWCPTCVVLSAEIDKIGEFLKERGVAVIEVFVQDSPAKVESYFEGEPKPMIHHALLDDGQVHEAYRVYMIPRLLVIDAEQTIRFDSLGRLVTAEDIVQMVEAYAPQEVQSGGE